MYKYQQVRITLTTLRLPHNTLQITTSENIRQTPSKKVNSCSKQTFNY